MKNIKLITREEITKAAGISKSAFGLYMKKGLIPYPMIQSNYLGKKGRFGLYPEWIIERITKIKSLIGEGYNLDAIEQRLASEIDPEQRERMKKSCMDEIESLMGKENLSREEIDKARNLLFLGWGMGTGPASDVLSYFAKPEQKKK